MIVILRDGKPVCICTDSGLRSIRLSRGVPPIVLNMMGESVTSLEWYEIPLINPCDSADLRRVLFLGDPPSDAEREAARATLEKLGLNVPKELVT